MIKHLIAIIVLSVAIVLSMSHAQQIVQYLVQAHEIVSQLLTQVFSTTDQVGNVLRGLVALLTIPVLIALIPGLLYWVVRKNWFPYFMQIVWAVWLLQTGALLVMTQV